MGRTGTLRGGASRGVQTTAVTHDPAARREVLRARRPLSDESPERFRVSIDGLAPSPAHGLDVGNEGRGIVSGCNS